MSAKKNSRDDLLRRVQTLEKENREKVRMVNQLRRELEKRRGPKKTSEEKSDDLSEINTAMKVLLKKREEDRIALEEKVLTNVKSLIQPYLTKLKRSKLGSRQKIYLEILESHINEIISPLSRKLSYDYLGVTPTEIKVATMVKQGKKAREIARMMDISVRTVEGYRYSLREKLGIKGKKINLRTYLLSME